MPRETRSETICRQKESRARKNKTDYVLLTEEERRMRVAKTEEECNFFLAKHLVLLDKAHAKGEVVGICLDVECDWVDPEYKPYQKENAHFWAKNLFQGISRNELVTQKGKNQGINNHYKKTIDSLIDNEEAAKEAHWQWRQELRTKGLPLCNILAIQIASTADPLGDLVFAMQINKLVESYGGKVKLPHLMRKLLTHPATVFVNANQYDDLLGVIDTFYEGKLEGVQYVEIQCLLKKAWGPEWDRADLDGSPESGRKVETKSGITEIHEYAFKIENMTWYKDFSCTCSHWWVKIWTDAQTHYALMDVFSPIMSLNHTLKNLSVILNRMALVFPLWFMTAEVAERKRTKNFNWATNGQHQLGDNDGDSYRRLPKAKASTFTPFQYNNSDDDENDVLSQS
jgi:hypothetical protein